MRAASLPYSRSSQGEEILYSKKRAAKAMRRTCIRMLGDVGGGRYEGAPRRPQRRGRRRRMSKKNGRVCICKRHRMTASWCPEAKAVEPLAHVWLVHRCLCRPSHSQNPVPTDILDGTVRPTRNFAMATHTSADPLRPSFPAHHKVSIGMLSKQRSLCPQK